jgi:hypothetical protein
VITGDYLNITQAGALETLLDWEQAAQPDDGESGRFLARVIEVEQLPARGKSFHPKSWRFGLDLREQLAVGFAFCRRLARCPGAAAVVRGTLPRACRPDPLPLSGLSLRGTLTA